MASAHSAAIASGRGCDQSSPSGDPADGQCGHHDRHRGDDRPTAAGRPRSSVASAVTTARISGGTSLEKNCTTRYPAAVTTSTIHGCVRRNTSAPQVIAGHQVGPRRRGDRVAERRAGDQREDGEQVDRRRQRQVHPVRMLPELPRAGLEPRPGDLRFGELIGRRPGDRRDVRRRGAGRLDGRPGRLLMSHCSWGQPTNDQASRRRSSTAAPASSTTSQPTKTAAPAPGRQQGVRRLHGGERLPRGRRQVRADVLVPANPAGPGRSARG